MSAEPLFNTNHRPFCDCRWKYDGWRHSCIKRQGHDGACYCCEDEEYPGGDLSRLLLEKPDA